MNHLCHKAQDKSWGHSDEPCECQCKPCREYQRMRNLEPLSEEQASVLWEIMTSMGAAGPWKATQLDGFGPVRFIVSDSPNEKWYPIVAELHNSGNMDGDKFIAWCRDGVPQLLLTIEKLNKEISELKEKLCDSD